MTIKWLFSVWNTFITKSSRFTTWQSFQKGQNFFKTWILPRTLSIWRLTKSLLLSLQKRIYCHNLITTRSVPRMLSANIHGLEHIKHVRLRLVATHWTVKESRIGIPFPPDICIFKRSFRNGDPLWHHRNTHFSRIPKIRLHLGPVF